MLTCKLPSLLKFSRWCKTQGKVDIHKNICFLGTKKNWLSSFKYSSNVKMLSLCIFVWLKSIYIFQITKTLISWINSLSSHTSPLPSLCLTFTIFHLIFSVLLSVSVVLQQRKLILPWLVSHSIIILLKIIIFSLSTFVTFFIDLLVFIVFPVITGVVLGISLLMWRLMLRAYTENFQRYYQHRFFHESWVM